MKKEVSFIILVVMCLTLCACGNKTNPQANDAPSGKFEISEDGKIIVTKTFLEQEEYNPTDALSSYLDLALLFQMNRAASARNDVHSSGWETKVKFSSYEITDTEFIDDCTIEIYGKLYGETVYDDSATCTFTVEVHFEEDSGNESGYSVCVDHWGLGNEYRVD